MLVSTRLIFDLQKALNTNKWNNLFSLKYPYELVITTKSPKTYNFSVNSLFLQRDWKYLALILLYTAILVVLKFFLEENSNLDRFLIFCIIFYATVYFTSVLFHKQESQQLSNFLNQLVQLEHRIFSRYKLKSNYLGNNVSVHLVKHSLNLFPLALKLHTLLHSLTSAIDPDVPWNMHPSFVFALIPSNLVSPTFLLLVLLKRFIIFVYTYISLKIYKDFAVINYILDLFVPTFCFTIALKQMQKHLKIIQLTNISLLEHFKTYREIQLILISYNCIHRKILFPLLIIAGILCLSGGAFILISLSTQLQFTTVVVFVNVMVLGAGSILVCFYFAALVYKISVQTISLFKCTLLYCGSDLIGNQWMSKNMKFKFSRKFVRSLCPLKVRFLHSNYFESLTPLVLFKFSIRLALQLMLIMN